MVDPAAPGATPRRHHLLPLWLALTISIPASSTAVLFIKLTEVQPLYLVCGRLLGAALILAPLAVRDLRRRGTPLGLDDLRRSAAPALLLAIHFWLWTIGTRLAPAVDATLIGNLMPVAMPMVIFLLHRELPNGREAMGGVLGVVGVICMAALAAGTHQEHAALGDALCAISLIAVALYLARARGLQPGQLWIYLVPLYAMAGILSLGVALLYHGMPHSPAPRLDALYIAGLAIFPTVIGHSINNRAMSEMRPTTVGMLSLLQVPIVGGAAWLIWRTQPTAGFYIAVCCVLGAFAILTYPTLRARFIPAVADSA